MNKTGRNLSGQEARWERICSAHMMSAQYDREMCLQHRYGWLSKLRGECVDWDNHEQSTVLHN